PRHVIHILLSARPASAPPPFPTRRSSDLLARLGAGFAVAVEAVKDRYQTHQVQRRQHAADHHDGQGPPRLGADLGRERRRQEAEDRKSTRLNSSHRTISYAVFCLKKKTKG